MIAKSVSFIIVIVQVSNVRSPAIFKTLPLKGTSIGATLDAGRFAALTQNLALFKMSFKPSTFTAGGKASSHSNRFERAPPPLNLLLKSVIFLNGGGLSWVLVAMSCYFLKLIKCYRLLPQRIRQFL